MGRLDTTKINQTASLQALATGLRAGFSEIALFHSHVLSLRATVNAAVLLHDGGGGRR